MMSMRGNTPRSRTWPGCLAIIAFGLTFLPMLPALPGDPPRKKESPKADVEAANARLGAAQAEFQRQNAMLVRAAEELKKAQMAVDEAALLQRQKEVEALKKNKLDMEKKGGFRIEITFSDDDSVHPFAIVETIDKALPAKLRGRINLTCFGSTKTPPLTNNPRRVNTSSSEKRLNDLEKKLEKVLQELHGLRNQMKASRSKSTVNPPVDPTRP